MQGRKLNPTAHILAPSRNVTLGTVFCLALGLIGGSSGCGSETAVSSPRERPVSFSADIQPILATNCAGCHSRGGSADLSGIELTLTEDVAYEELVHQQSVQRRELAFIVAGDAGSSLFYLKVSSDDPPVGVRMPRFAPPLLAGEIDLIRRWIEQGALNN